MDDKLQKDIDKQRVYLAGCAKMIPPATRHCFHCDQDVCYTFLPVDEAETTCVEFKICGFHKGYQKIAVKRIKIDLLLLIRIRLEVWNVKQVLI